MVMPEPTSDFAFNLVIDVLGSLWGELIRKKKKDGEERDGREGEHMVLSLLVF